MKTIVCYGDSNTWGMTPMITLDDRDRLDIHTRWAGVLRDTLGDEYWVVEEGLNGRTTVWEDSLEPDRNGATYLTPCLLTHSPIDLVILMLGTNDLKHRFGKSPYDIASGAGFLVETILRSECGPDAGMPDVLLMCPPPTAVLAPIFAGMFEGAYEKSRQLVPQYRAVADLYGVDFLDAGGLIVSSTVDGIHFDADQHQKLGQAVAEKVRAILG